MSEATIVLRLDQQLKSDFDWACAEADNTASQALRGYMRKFIEEVMAKKAGHLVIEQSAPGGAQFLYNKDDPEEVMTIKKTLFLIQEFETLHPGVPLWDYPEREKLKREGYDLLHDSKLPVDARTDGAVDVIKAHYMESARGSIKPERPTSIKSHPGFEEYARHYIPAVGLVKAFPPEVYDELVRRYPLDGPSRMHDSTSWPSVSLRK